MSSRFTAPIVQRIRVEIRAYNQHLLCFASALVSHHPPILRSNTSILGFVPLPLRCIIKFDVNNIPEAHISIIFAKRPALPEIAVDACF